MRVVLVYNTKSGEQSSLNDLRDLFADQSIVIIDTIQVSPRLKDDLQRHIENGEIVAVVGGDGTIGSVVEILNNTQSSLMPLPGGTMNHFTKDLGIPQDLTEALHYFRSARKTRIDTGKVGDHIFINNSSIGLYSDSLVERDEHQKVLGKWLAIVTSMAASLFRFRMYNVRIKNKDYLTPLIFIGNNRYEPGNFSFQRTRLNEGILCLYMAVGMSRLSLCWSGLNLLLGRKNIYGHLLSITTTELTISTNKTIRISRDGEHEKAVSPLRYQIQKASLGVLLQPSVSGTRLRNRDMP